MDNDSKQLANLFADLIGDKNLSEALEDGREFTFKPLLNITTYELALCLCFLLMPLADLGPAGPEDYFQTIRKMQTTFDALPPEVQRHFHVHPISS
jgi:hypothetical protein